MLILITCLRFLREPEIEFSLQLDSIDLINCLMNLKEGGKKGGREGRREGGKKGGRETEKEEKCLYTLINCVGGITQNH